MATRHNQALLEEALRAGAARDYEKASYLLTTLIAEGGAPTEALLFLGRSYHGLGAPGRAVESFRAYLRAGGDQARGHFHLGRTLLAAGLLPEAWRALRRSVEADPRKASAWALLGAAELKLRKIVSAVEHLERAVELAPADARIYRGYLNALFVKGIRTLMKGDADLAAQTFAFVIANGLDGTAARLWRAKALRELGKTAEALAECDAAAGHSPGDPSIAWLRSGLLLSIGRKAEALAIVRTLDGSAAAPSDPRALEVLRAQGAFKRGDWREAAAACAAALRRPGDFDAKARAGLHALAAESLRMSGQLQRARVEAEKAATADPAAPELRLALAMAYWDLGLHREALEAAESARSLGGDGDECGYIAALCHARLGTDTEATLAFLQRLLRERTAAGRGLDPRHLFAIGECLYRQGRPDLAGGWFDKVLILEPGHELASLYRISVAESLEDLEGRKSAYAAYLAAYPDNLGIRREYAELLAATEAWKEAASVLEGGLAYAALSAASRKMLARAWRETGRYGEAAVMYRDLLLSEPEDGELLMALCLCLHSDGKTAFAHLLLEKAPEAAMRRAGPWVVKGILAEKLRKREAAIDAFRRATELEPRLERPWKELARIYEKIGLGASAEEARRMAEVARRSGPKSGGAGTGAGRGRPGADREIPRPGRKT